MAGKVKKQASFEDQLARLEAIAEDMEGGQRTLDEQLALFQEGMELSGEINKRLEATSARLTEIARDAEGTSAVADAQPTLLDGMGER